jgi:phage-related tail fiber protein
VLRDATLNPVPDGNYPMIFSIWDAESAGTKRWGDESHPAVPTVNGMFSVYLGGSQALGNLFQQYGALWLEVSANTGTGMETYTPRVPLASVPYAQNAATAAQAVNADTVDGQHASAFAAAGTLWALSGNALSGSEFLGTTNATALSIRTNGAERIRVQATGNVGIGTGAPQASALLDVASTTQGFAMPRMTSAQRRAIASPVTGLQVFDTNLNGVYYWTGSKWDALSTPVGTVIYFAGSSAPAGYVECNNQLLSTTTFAELFAVVGTTYGSGSGTFRVPELRGEFIRVWDNGRGADSGRNLGTWQAQDWKSFSMWGAQNSSGYAHEVYMGKNFSYAGTMFFGGYWSNPNSGIRIAWDGSEIRPRNTALMACIKY